MLNLSGHGAQSHAEYSDKTPSDVVGGVEIDVHNIASSMIHTSEAYRKNSRIRLHHFIISFLPWEIYNPSILICIAEDISKYIGQEFQIVYALHEDNYYPHLHFVFNAISYIDGHRYRGGIKEYRDLVHLVGRILKSYGISNYNPVEYVPQTDNPHE